MKSKNQPILAFLQIFFYSALTSFAFGVLAELSLSTISPSWSYVNVIDTTTNKSAQCIDAGIAFSLLAIYVCPIILSTPLWSWISITLSCTPGFAVFLMLIFSKPVSAFIVLGVLALNWLLLSNLIRLCGHFTVEEMNKKTV